ncbi:MAG: xylulokinase [Clostridiales Family XIII bacterium]|jgi:xylulokinase|nr:xylulokinase [Clostridiales Family XIII bacterium]
MRALLGIDVGTSGTKTVLYSVDGAPLASHTAEYPMAQPKNGWAEQDPCDWWRAAVEGIGAVLAKGSAADAVEIAGIGLSGQMHGLVMLDADGAVLRPSIIWCDQRTEAEIEDMKRILGEKRIIEITANPPMTGFTAAKILWVKKNEPEVYAKCAHILLPKDYIRYRLTGEFATEVSDASGMQLMDVAGRKWSDEVLGAFGIDKALLAKMHESQDVTGVTSAACAKETGLAEGIPVVGGAGDNPAAAVGTGVVAHGKAFTTIGTSAVVYAVSDEVRIDLAGRVHSLCASVPGKWTVMSCTQGAGLSLQWLRNNVCTEEMRQADAEGVDPYILMDKLADGVPIGADRLLFLPYLMGERSPHPDPDCRGVFCGLSGVHTRANLIRAVLEGVAYSQRECVEVFREMGVPADDMMITGGGAKSRIWRQMLADLYGCAVSVPKPDEGAALGAAILAGVGTGVWGSLGEACGALIGKGETIQPDPARGAAYEPYYELYKKLYRDLKEDFKTLARI